MPKSKRQTRKVSSRVVAEATSNGSKVAGSKVAGSSSMYEREFNPDYSQTIKDLKRIGILASSFIALLVVLSFFLR